MMEKYIKFGILFSISLFLLIFFEYLARNLLIETPYFPGPKIKKIQSLLKVDSSIGFIWKENISFHDSIFIPWADQELELLSTDNNGFRNFPEAINLKNNNYKMNIIGLGDSFIHDAAFRFYNFFMEQGYFYYNLAMHRHSPPQYNIILKQIGLKYKPDLFIYGIYKNDFFESTDFLKWQKSNVNWFVFHSGLWAGPVSSFGFSEYLSESWLKGSYAFLRMLQSKVISKTQSSYITEGKKIVRNCISEASDICKSNKIDFLVLLIPSKENLFNNEKNDNYKSLEKFLNQNKIQYLDLTKLFLKRGNTQELYYKIDGHWNKIGMEYCASLILKYLKNNE